MCAWGIWPGFYQDEVRLAMIATSGAIRVPPAREVVKVESSKNIGAVPHIMTRGGGRFNTIQEICERYLMSQSYVVKAGDFFLQESRPEQ
jgi:hypothetical protein